MLGFIRPFTVFVWGKCAVIASVCAVGVFAGTSAQAAGCKLPKSYYKHVSCTPNGGLFLAVKDYGEPVALINNKGKPVVNLTAYQTVAADKIASGVMPVLKNSRVGYINLQGREVVAPIYDQMGGAEWARAASENRIVVKKGGQYGVIDTNNGTIVPFSGSITNITNYRSGVARIESRQGSRNVDTSGNTIASEPAAPKTASNQDSPTTSNTLQNSTSKNSISQDSRRDPPQSTAVNTTVNTSEPKREPFTTLIAHQQDGLWGFVDKYGVIMITYSFDEVRPFSEGLAAVRIENTWGFLDLGGNVVIPFDYHDDARLNRANNDEPPAWTFKNGVAWVGMSDKGERLCINTANVTLPCPS